MGVVKYNESPIQMFPFGKGNVMLCHTPAESGAEMSISKPFQGDDLEVTFQLLTRKIPLGYQALRKVKTRFSETDFPAGITITITTYHSQATINKVATITIAESEKWYVLPLGISGEYFTVSTDTMTEIEYIEFLRTGD
jgi:hypothetical protein